MPRTWNGTHDPSIDVVVPARGAPLQIRNAAASSVTATAEQNANLVPCEQPRTNAGPSPYPPNMRVSPSVRRRLWWLPAALKVLLAIAVVSSPFLYDRFLRTIPTATAEIVAAPTCTAPSVPSEMTGGTNEPALGLPEPGRVPDGFEPTEVAVCLLGEEDPTGLTVIEERRTGELQPLLDALAEPSRPKSWFSGCTASTAPTPLIWLVDRTGAAILAALPREAECGLIAYPPLREVDNLTLTTTVIHVL